MDLQGFTYYKDHWYEASATSPTGGPWHGEVTICAKAVDGRSIKIFEHEPVPGQYFSEGEAWQHARDYAEKLIDEGRANPDSH
ncbi:hypothetical protein ACU4GI_02080 [Cupriavidus basilensis]|uniref:hypothetical protein n=1 Tax=Cupriavidus TaxID=106589 RepID=UPI00044682FD|nr:MULTISPECIES: hypothetical protein [Cupriavidus]KDP85824.1 hypothetical protein CF70_011730 [Cupriavidus sp. SK-3]MDF3884202.1 hypothetical protein [Cupriavidus basilensis]